MKRLHETETSPVAYDTAPKKIRSALKQELKIIIKKRGIQGVISWLAVPLHCSPVKCKLYFLLFTYETTGYEHARQCQRELNRRLQNRKINRWQKQCGVL